MNVNIRTIFLLLGFLSVLPVLYAQNRITVTLQDFNKLSVSGRASVELIPSESHTMSITSQDGQPEEVEYEIKNGELKIRARADLKKENRIFIKVPYSKIEDIEAIAGAVINSKEDLKSKDLNLKALAGGKIELSIEASMVDAKTNQGSDIILYGKSRIQNVVANTGGNYLAYDMDCEEAYVKSSSGSQIKVKVSKKIEAKANSKGFVGYTGDPEITQVQTSMGGIIEVHRSGSQ